MTATENDRQLFLKRALFYSFMMIARRLTAEFAYFTWKRNLQADFLERNQVEKALNLFHL